MGRLEGKVIIITGAGSGLGRYTSKVLAREGAKIVVADVNDAGGEETVGMLKEQGADAMFVHVDITKLESCENMVKQAKEHYGKIDVMWANAGFQDYNCGITNADPAMIQKAIDINVNGTYYTCKAVAEEIVNTRGNIIITASAAADHGNLGRAHYTMTKGAVRSLTYTLANELGMYGVCCNCISPYTVWTERVKDWPASQLHKTEAFNPMFKMIDIDSIANTVLFLATDEAKSINGLDIRIDAGAAVMSQPKNVPAFVAKNPYPNATQAPDMEVINECCAY